MLITFYSHSIGNALDSDVLEFESAGAGNPYHLSLYVDDNDQSTHHLTVYPLVYDYADAVLTKPMRADLLSNLLNYCAVHGPVSPNAAEYPSPVFSTHSTSRTSYGCPKESSNAEEMNQVNILFNSTTR